MKETDEYIAPLTWNEYRAKSPEEIIDTITRRSGDTTKDESFRKNHRNFPDDYFMQMWICMKDTAFDRNKFKQYCHNRDAYSDFAKRGDKAREQLAAWEILQWLKGVRTQFMKKEWNSEVGDWQKNLTRIAGPETINYLDSANRN
ncbi:MAG TPA: hypothetical protein VL651_09375 [Bacteroidia bacterium]|nr:hypothetical protein [Bacteroidia bacterium]